MKFLKQLAQAGMSMVEMTIAGGLLAAGGAAMMNMTTVNTENMTKLSSGGSITNITNHTHSILQSRVACLNTFGGQTVGSSVPSIKDELLNVFYPVGRIIEGIDIRSISLEAPDQEQSTFAIPSSAGLLNIRMVIINKRLPKADPVIRKIKLWVQMDAGLRIVKCMTPLILSGNLWQTTFENPDNIYYGHFVGAGVQDPAAMADVAGRIRFLSQDGVSAGTIGKNSGNRISLQVNRGMRILREVTNPDGTVTRALNDITVKDLVSTHLVQPGVGGGACVPSNEGTIRYNARVAKTQYCDGQWWRSFESE